MERLRIPQYLHRPYQVLFFEVDELVVVILTLFLGLCFGSIFWVLTIPVVFLLSYFKKKYPRGYIKHVFYMTGLVVFKGAPNYFETKFEE